MIGSVQHNNKFQYIKRQDVWKIENGTNKAKINLNEDNLAFSDDQVLEDKLDLKFTIRDSGEWGIEIIFFNSRDEVASSIMFYHSDSFDLGGQMLIAGSGNSVYIKDIRIKRKEKLLYNQEVDSRQYDCCNIF